MKKIFILLLFTLFVTGCSSSRKPLVCEKYSEGGTADMNQTFKIVDKGSELQSITIIEENLVKDEYIGMYDELIVRFDEYYNEFMNIQGVTLDKVSDGKIYTVTIHFNLNKMSDEKRKLFFSDYNTLKDIREDLESEKFNCSYKN